MIQDIAPHKFHNEYEAKKPDQHSYVLAFRERQVYLHNAAETIDFLTYEEIQNLCKKKNIAIPQMIYLFSVDEQKYFLSNLNEIELPDGGYYNLFAVRSMQPKEHVMAVSTAWHLYVWYRDHQFCGRCGARLQHDTGMRMLACPSCGNQVFPQIAPAVIVGVTHGKKILMTKYAGREYKRYALIAGFTEIGETPEQTVRREVMEEVGLQVHNIRYYGSQPWGFDSNLLLGYYCDLQEGDEQITLDQEELSLAEWVDYRHVPEDREGLSLTAEMMVHFRDNKGKV
ncbi:MAG: NAD(+) diphosphatase [Eubacteriales bacterium]|nr:NAD(+) diphosphatase [Eubacteriales bacterium]